MKQQKYLCYLFWTDKSESINNLKHDVNQNDKMCQIKYGDGTLPETNITSENRSSQ